MRRFHAMLALALALAILVLGGCGLKGVMKPSPTPDTIIFIDGAVDTVNHVVHLHWFGSITSGYIAGYEVRLLNPEAPADSSWLFTTRTDSLITVVTPNGFSAAVFEARAIDDRGVRDPEPARQPFKFRNNPPIVRLTSKPNSADRSDTTFASATVEWIVSDPDGDENQVVSRVWLNGRADTPLIASGNSFTMPSDQFLEDGVFKSGPRKLYIQGIDDGGMAGPIDSVRWYVRSPVTGSRARLLLVDDVSGTGPAKTRVDTLYSNAVVNAGVQPGDWSVLHLQTTQPFRSSKDLEQTMRQFETVVWYRGEQTAFSRVLASYGDEGVGRYLDAGGRMFIESLNLIATPYTDGALSLDFVSHYLNSDGVFRYAFPPDSSSSWGLAGTAVFPCPLIADSLLNTRIVAGLRAFQTRDASQVLTYVPAHALSQDNPFPMAVALSVPQSAGGRLIVSTYPMVSATVPTPAFPQRASIVLLKIYGLLGLTGP